MKTYGTIFNDLSAYGRLVIIWSDVPFLGSHVLLAGDQWFVFVDYGFYKLDAKTKTSNGVDFNTVCSSNHDSGKFLGNIETKYKWSEYGKNVFFTFPKLKGCA